MRRTAAAPEPSSERLAVLERIRELEECGCFHTDAENDPEARPLIADEITYLNNSPMSVIKRKTAFTLAYLYFFIERLKKHVMLNAPVGIESLSGSGAAIITCNHFSPYDSFIMQQLFDRSRRTGKLYRIIREGNYTGFGGFYGFLMRNCNTLPLSRDLRCAAKLSRALEAVISRGDSILIYPEQSLWWNYRKPKPAKSGAFDLAVRYGVPVIPVFITMQDSELIGADGFPVQIYTPHVGKPIYPNAELGKKAASEELARQHLAFCNETYENFYGEPPKYMTKPEFKEVKS